MVKYLCPILLLLILTACASKQTPPSSQSTKTFTPMDNIRISYGADSLQFGNLIIPDVSNKATVIMIIHGGCWRSKYDYTLMDEMSMDLAKRGYATWNIEYRRTEDEGGQWPGTITDVALALKELNNIAEDYLIDLDNIIVMGHSAGGHLALMLGAQSKMDSNSDLKINDLPSIKGIVSLAGITDLMTYLAPEGCGSNVLKLVGGAPEELPGRYLAGSPITYLPIGIPQKLITGIKDDIVPIAHIQPYYDKATDLEDPVELIKISDAGHFEVINPESDAWPVIVEAIGELAIPK